LATRALHHDGFGRLARGGLPHCAYLGGSLDEPGPDTPSLSIHPKAIASYSRRHARQEVIPNHVSWALRGRGPFPPYTRAAYGPAGHSPWCAATLPIDLFVKIF